MTPLGPAPAAVLGLPGGLLGVLVLDLEALLSAQVAAVLEHVARVWVQGPVGALAGLVGRAGHLDEAVVEGERVADGVLPALLVLAVVREEVHDPLVDLVEGQHLVARLLDGHGDEGDVRVRGLGVRERAAVRLGHVLGAAQGVGRGVAELAHRLAHVGVVGQGAQGGGWRAQLGEGAGVEGGGHRGQAHVVGTAAHGCQRAAAQAWARVTHAHGGGGAGRVQVDVAVDGSHGAQTGVHGTGSRVHLKWRKKQKKLLRFACYRFFFPSKNVFPAPFLLYFQADLCRCF